MSSTPAVTPATTTSPVEYYEPYSGAYSEAYEKLEQFKSIKGNPLNEKQGRWWGVINAYLSTFKHDLQELKAQVKLESARGYWLDRLGQLAEIKRSNASFYQQSNPGELDGAAGTAAATLDDDEKKRRDNLFRTAIEIKLSSIYDDFTYNVMSELEDIFLRVETGAEHTDGTDDTDTDGADDNTEALKPEQLKLLVRLTTDSITYSFINLSQKEIDFVKERQGILKNFTIGRSQLFVDLGSKDTVYSAEASNKAGEVTHVTDDDNRDNFYLGGRLGTKFIKERIKV